MGSQADEWASRMLGSLTLYKRLLLENVFSNPQLRNAIPFTSSQRDLHALPSFGHGIAGIMAGCTVSFIAAPVEHIKARLQIQYAADKKQRMYSGPIDCSRKIVSFSFLFLQECQLTCTDPEPWYSRTIPWSLRNTHLPIILLLLVGILRHPHPHDAKEYQPLCTSHQLLGRWYIRANILDHVLPFGCRQEPIDDRSARRLTWRRRETLPSMERCCCCCIS